MRRAARVDANHKEIVSVLRAHGFTVADCSGVGSGFPDIVFARAGHNYLAEIKDGKKIPSKRRLTPDQIEWHNKWHGEIFILESVEDALLVIQKISSRIKVRSGE